MLDTRVSFIIAGLKLLQLWLQSDAAVVLDKLVSRLCSPCLCGSPSPIHPIPAPRCLSEGLFWADICRWTSSQGLGSVSVRQLGHQFKTQTSTAPYSKDQIPPSPHPWSLAHHPILNVIGVFPPHYIQNEL